MEKRASRAAFWRARVTEWQRSGQTQAAYCSAQGLHVSSLRYWIKRQHDEGTRAVADGARLTLIAARPVASSPVSGVELTLRSPSGWALAFASRPPAPWLRELLGGEAGQ